ncbi:MAG: SDR family oxidoreductase [Myxococcota bacterium]
MKDAARKTALVTGGGRDIGRGIAEELGRQGYHVIIHVNQSRDGAEEASRKIERVGAVASVVQADLATPEGPTKLVDDVIQILAKRTLDVLVLNAAATFAVPVGSREAGSIEVMTRVNLISPVVITNGLQHHMSDGASILALSVAATRSVFSPDFAFFASTKSAMETMVRGWARALGPRRIRVNAVSPGVVAVNFRAKLLQDEEFRAELHGDTALGRAGRVDDVVSVIRFLVSAESGWITGQVVEASGGWRL